MQDQQVKIRPLDLSDIKQLAALANNKNVSNNLRDYFPYPYYEQDAEDFIRLTQSEKPQQNFGIEYRNELCGVIGLIIQPDVYRKSAELGFWIGEPYWGKGIASRAVKLITNYGFDELKLERLYSGVFDYNMASMKVLEKNGYKKEGVFRNAVFKNGHIYDEHRYYKLKKGFARGT